MNTLTEVIEALKAGADLNPLYYGGSRVKTQEAMEKAAGLLEGLREFRDFLSREINDYDTMLGNDKASVKYHGERGELQSAINMAQSAKENEIRSMMMRRAQRALDNYLLNSRSKIVVDK